ncbi:MAG: hypothetical protein IJB97_04680 [Clostridia bacterium]|nr:hypothetical protein [Clostridia bacterium]
MDKWIWLPKNLYPNAQSTRFDVFSGASRDIYTVAEFQRVYRYDKKIERVKLRFSGDTAVQLFCNGEIVATGPAAVGGDFIANGKARDWYYAFEMEHEPKTNALDFFARVKIMPVQMYEYSKGHGGFMLSACIYFQDGSVENIQSDESWLVRKNGAYAQPKVYDGTVKADAFVKAEVIDDIWHAETAPIPVRKEEKFTVCSMTLAPQEERVETFTFDKIYAGFLQVSAVTDGVLSMDIKFRELDEENGSEESLKMTNRAVYRGFFMHSAGNVSVRIKNRSDTSSKVQIDYVTTFYPVVDEAVTRTDDEVLNLVLDVCKHTLKYCRQTLHIDSPRHCEPLACTGDYYIESLMTAFSFGDQRLSEFDVLRTAKLLRYNDGRMFHTTYSLIWVRMLYDTYMMGGNFSLLTESADALKLLLNRFETYIGKNGIVDNPPDYMFVDWIYIDGFSMHHPPKCLGQTVLNAFYYMALCYASKIFYELGDIELAKTTERQAKNLKNAVNNLLYDKEKGMYFEGLNTPTAPKQISVHLPANSTKRYYLKHSNIMAAYVSLCDGDMAKILVEKIINDEIEGDVQPYFMHYLLEAIYGHGLREKYTLKVIEKWKKPIADCSKGLTEGFVAPEPTYRFDHSHAWGGTPLWSLPKALIGLSIDKPGFKEITLAPSLLGLSHATVELLTPHGRVTCTLEKGEVAKIVSPNSIKVRILCDKIL